MENYPQQATPATNREMERRLKGLYKRGDAGALHWMARMLASQKPLLLSGASTNQPNITARECAGEASLR